jgi:pantoate kinase
MIRKKQPKKEIIIDLTGPDGNAFALMGYAKRFAKQLGLDSSKIINEMTSGDYEHLLEVFDKNFGSFVILER